MSIRKKERRFKRICNRWVKFELLAGVEHHSTSKALEKAYDRFAVAYNRNWQRRLQFHLKTGFVVDDGNGNYRFADEGVKHGTG